MISICRIFRFSSDPKGVITSLPASSAITSCLCRQHGSARRASPGVWVGEINTLSNSFFCRYLCSHFSFAETTRCAAGWFIFVPLSVGQLKKHSSVWELDAGFAFVYEICIIFRSLCASVFGQRRRQDVC